MQIIKTLEDVGKNWMFYCPVAMANGHFGCAEHWRNHCHFVDLNEEKRYPLVRGPLTLINTSNGLVFSRRAVRSDGRIGGNYFHDVFTGKKIKKTRIHHEIFDGRRSVCNNRYAFFAGDVFFSRDEESLSGTPEAIAAALKEIELYYVMPRKKPDIGKLQQILFISAQDGSEVRVMDLGFIISAILPSSDGHTLLAFDCRCCAIIDID